MLYQSVQRSKDYTISQDLRLTRDDLARNKILELAQRMAVVACQPEGDLLHF